MPSSSPSKIYLWLEEAATSWQSPKRDWYVCHRQYGFPPGIEPWLPVNTDYDRIAQRKDSNSLLNWYRALVQLRKREPSLQARCYR